MTEPTRTQQLRAISEKRDLHVQDRALIYASLGPLLDVADAAQAFEPLPDKWANGDERQRLRDALNQLNT